MASFSLQTGHLKQTPVLQVLAAAQLSQVTGVLKLTNGPIEKSVLFCKGAVAGARSNQLSESLGRLLVAWGWVSKEAYLASLERMESGRERHGEILASMGALDPARIPEALQRQVWARLVDAASWTAGQYEFIPQEVSEPTIDIALVRIFQEGMFRRHGKEKIEATARQQRDAVPRRLNGVLEPFVYTAPELLGLLGRLDGRRSVAELGQKEANPRLYFTNLLVLMELGLVEMGAPIEEDPLAKAFRWARGLSPAALLGVAPNASPQEVQAAAGRLLDRFSAEKYQTSKYYALLVSLIENAANLLLHGANRVSVLPDARNGRLSPQAERAFQIGKDYLAKRQVALARQKFEEAVFCAPENDEMRAYLAWAQFLENPADETKKFDAVTALRAGVASEPNDADLQAYLGAALRLTGQYVEAEEALKRAIALQAGHAFALREMESLNLRRRQADAQKIAIDSIQFDAKIVLQRWIGAHSVILNFQQPEIRLGSGVSDDLVVSNQVLKQVVQSHCTVIARDPKHFVRRNGSGGVVLVNGQPIGVREEVWITHRDRVSLGDPALGPVLEFRVLDAIFLEKLKASRMAGDDFWRG